MAVASDTRHWPVVSKPHEGWRVAPNLTEYEQARRFFSWDAARERLEGLPDGGGLNIAHEAVDCHAPIRGG